MPSKPSKPEEEIVEGFSAFVKDKRAAIGAWNCAWDAAYLKAYAAAVEQGLIDPADPGWLAPGRGGSLGVPPQTWRVI